jgi:hypothetical protein
MQFPLNGANLSKWICISCRTSTLQNERYAAVLYEIQCRLVNLIPAATRAGIATMETKQQFHKRISCNDTEAKLETVYLVDEEDLKKIIRDQPPSADASRAVEASQELERANEKRLNLVQRRLKRNWIAKQGKHIQAFASATAKFLDSYQGIPKLLESSNAGRLVYGTLLILISVSRL